MAAGLDRRCWRFIAAMACVFAPCVASAQLQTPTPTATWSLDSSGGRLRIGDVVYVTDATGVTLKGRLAAATTDAVQMDVKGDLRTISTPSVRRIQWQKPDSLVNGALIGAAVGAAPGLYWLAADPNECQTLCIEEYALVAVGAVVGALIDHAIKKRVTVYPVGTSNGRAASPVIGPLFAILSTLDVQCRHRRSRSR
jgi:hypothetical protein